MVMKRGGLGRNLSALLTPSGMVSTLKDTLQSKLTIDCIQPGKYQPRADIDEASVLELAESIKKQGLLQPLVVREVAPGRYEILAGERRWRACQLVGMHDVPVVIRQVDDETAMAIALVENLQRQDLNAIEQARAMHRLTTEFALTHQQIALLLSKSRAAVTNYLRLLNCCGEVRRMLEEGVLDMGHARSLLMLDEPEQAMVAQKIVANQLSVREAEALVTRMRERREDILLSKKPELAPSLESALQTLAHQLRSKVFVKHGKAGKGSLVIHFDSEDGLQQMIGQLIE